MTGSPLVSIGMPVRNGAAHLARALASLAAQDHPGLELHIADNASSDDTPALAREFCSRHPWAHYHRFDEVAPAQESFGRAYDLCQGELFCWAAHDDQWSPSFVSELAAALSRGSPGAVLAVPSVAFVDAAGVSLERPDPYASLPAESSGTDFLARAFEANAPAAVYGLFRRRAIAGEVARLRRARYAWGYDHVFLARLLFRPGARVSYAPRAVFVECVKPSGLQPTKGLSNAAWLTWFSLELARAATRAEDVLAAERLAVRFAGRYWRGPLTRLLSRRPWKIASSA